MTVNYKDLISGLFFIVVGAFFCLNAYFNLTIGTAMRMGPGYFPILVGILVMGLGAAIVVTGFNSEDTPFGAIPWRGLIMISIAPIVFGICIRGLGLAPTIALTSVVACLASHNVGAKRALWITVGLTAFCLAVFHWGIALPIRLFGPWLGFLPSALLNM